MDLVHCMRVCPALTEAIHSFVQEESAECNGAY